MKNKRHHSTFSTCFLLSLAALALVIPAHAESVAFNLKARMLPNGNLSILGYDNVEREAVLITPDEYAFFTNAVVYLNTFKDFRERLHGAVVKRETDVERRVLCFHHADGYVWEEPMRQFTGTVARPKVAPAAPAKPDWMTDRQWALRKRRESAKETRELNATYAPGGKLMEVKP